MEYFIYMTNDCNLKCEYCSVLLDCKENNLPIKPTYSNDDLIAFIKQTQMLTGDDEISKNEFLNSTAQWGDGIYSRTVDIYSFIQSCYGYDSF